MRPAPSDTAPVEQIKAWCDEADQHLGSLGVGFPPDTFVRLTVRALAAAMGCDPDELDCRIEIERLRLLTSVMDEAEAAAVRAKLLGGIQLPGQNGQNGHPR